MRTMRTWVAAAAVLAATLATGHPALAQDVDAIVAKSIEDGPYAEIGSYEQICAVESAGLYDLTGPAPTDVCLRPPASIPPPEYTDSWLCSARGVVVIYIDSEGNTREEIDWQVSGYVSTTDARAYRTSVTCTLKQGTTTVGSMTNTASAKSVSVSGTATTPNQTTRICASGTIWYRYGNTNRTRYVGNPSC